MTLHDLLMSNFRVSLTAGIAFGAVAMLAPLACSSAPDDADPAASEPPTVTTAAPPAARSGQDIFASICSACHGLKGQGQPNWHIPNADGTLPAPPLNGDGHTWHHADGLLYRIVRDGGKIQEDPVLLPNFKSAMPAFGPQLSHEEIVAAIDYVKSLWRNKTSRGLNIVEAQAIRSMGDPFPDG